MTFATALTVPRAAKALSLEAAIAVALALFLAVAAGNRWFGDGRDYLYYFEFYERLGLATNFTEERFEPGFTAGAWLFKFGLGLPYSAYATTLVAGALASKFALFFRYCNQPLLACLIYCAAFYPLHEYTQIRIAVALAFAMPGAIVAVLGRPVRGGLIILAGATFQSSVLVVGVGVGIALLLRLNLAVLFLLLGIVALVAQALVPEDPIGFLTAFNPMAQDYLAQLDAVIPNIFSVPIITTTIIIVSLLPFVLMENDRLSSMSYVMCLLSVVTFLLLREIPAFAHRFREVFAVFAIIMVFAGRTTGMHQAMRILLVMASLWLLAQYIVDGIV